MSKGDASAESECPRENAKRAAIAGFAGQGSGPLCGERDVLGGGYGSGIMNARRCPPVGKPIGLMAKERLSALALEGL